MKEAEAIKNIQSWFIHYEDTNGDEGIKKPKYVSPTYRDDKDNIKFYLENQINFDNFVDSKDGKLYQESIKLLFDIYQPKVCYRLHKREGFNTLRILATDNQFSDEEDDSYHTNDEDVTKEGLKKKKDFYKSTAIEEYANDFLLEILYTKIYLYKYSDNFSAWLNTTIHRMAIDRIKKTNIPEKDDRTKNNNTKNKFIKLGKLIAQNSNNYEKCFKEILDFMEQIKLSRPYWNWIFKNLTIGINSENKNSKEDTKKILKIIENDLVKNNIIKPYYENKSRYIAITSEQWEQIESRFGLNLTDDQKQDADDCVKEALLRYCKKGNEDQVLALNLSAIGTKQKQISLILGKTYVATKKFIESSRKIFAKFSRDCWEMLLDSYE